MTRQILLIACLLLAGMSFAQKVAVEIGPEIKIDKDMNFWGHLHSDAKNHYVLLIESQMGFFSRKGISPILQKYDRKFNLVFSKELKVDDDDISFGNMLYGKDKFLLCTQTREKKAKKVTYSSTIIDMDGKVGKPQKVAVVQYSDKDDEPTGVSWKMSDDTTKMMVATVADDNDDDLKAKVMVAVHDNQLNKLWNKAFTLPYTQEQLSARSWTVANDGQVYLLAKVYDEKRNKESKKKDGKRKPAYKMIIFRFDAASEKPKEFVLALQEKFVTDVTFKLSPTNDLTCAGFYANDTKGIIQGVFFTRINGQTGNVDMATKKELSSKDIANLDTSKDRGGDEGLDAEYTFNELILREDGGIVVAAEEEYSITTTSMQGNRMVTRTTYYNNEIFITSIGPSGTIEWVKVIPKKQIFSGTNMFNGYMHMVSGSNMYFLYNDDEDNIKKPLSAKAKRISSFKDAVAALVTVTSDGSMKRRQVFDSKEDADALMVPSNGEQISPNELFFVTTRFKLFGKTRLRMGLVRV